MCEILQECKSLLRGIPTTNGLKKADLTAVDENKTDYLLGQLFGVIRFISN